MRCLGVRHARICHSTRPQFQVGTHDEDRTARLTATRTGGVNGTRQHRSDSDKERQMPCRRWAGERQMCAPFDAGVSESG